MTDTQTSNTSTNHLKAFAAQMIAQIEAQADMDGSSDEQVIVSQASEALGELDQAPELTWVDLIVAGSKSQPAILVHAWAIDQHERLHLAAVLTPKQSVAEANLPYVFQRKEVDDGLKKMLNLVSYLKQGHVLGDENDPKVEALAKAARKTLEGLDPEVVLHLITTGHFRGTIPSHTLTDVIVSSHVHDIEWFRRLVESDSGEQLDFRDQGGLPCLVASQDEHGEPDVLVTVLKGDFLAELYDRRRDELLRRNVRIYLRQTRKVNQEIAQSARKNPERFVALNNGISAVATGVSLNAEGRRIETLNDLQIVNGGQTTATLHEVWRDRRNPADLSKVSIQAKITIIRDDGPQGDQLAQDIALAANSQNRISMSDLLSGDPYEHSLEEISRERRYTSGSVSTGWYYERIRGQHAGLLALDKKNEKVFPKDQVVDKAYAAQLILAWEKQPYRSSRGREKALKGYKDDLRKKANGGPLAKATEQDFDRLVGLAVIRREAEGAIAQAGTMKPPLGFYLLAWLSEHLSHDIDLNQIARTGLLPERLIRVIQQVTPLISEVMRTHPESTPHEGERPKKEACWDEVKKIQLPDAEPTQPREYTRQDWQAALTWAEGKRNRVLREKIKYARKTVQSGKTVQHKEKLDAIMQEAIKAGFKFDTASVKGAT